MLTKVVLSNGQWSPAGNYVGKSTKYGKIHVYGKTMEALGFQKDKPVPVLYAIADLDAEFSKQDKEGNPIPGTEFKRATAEFVFKSEKELHQAGAAESLLLANERAFIKSQAKEAGLTEEEAAALLQASI